MTSIFSRIFRYRQSEGRTPREDYFTETFADVLCKSKLFKKVFLMWLFDELELENIRSIRLETQKRFGNLRPDIFVKVGDTNNMSYVAIIESKIDSCVGEGQLEAYDGILSNYWPNAQSRILVYITKYNEDVGDYEASDDIDFRQTKWSVLYKILYMKFAEAKQENSEEVGDLEHELLKLMEDWQMNGNINAAHLRAFTTCFDTGIGDRLATIPYETWHDFEWNDGLELAGNWTHQWSYKGELYSPTIQPYGFRIWMGYRTDRRDDDWNVDELEIPSPCVTLCDYDGNGNIDQEFPPPSDDWIGPYAVEGWPNELWVRQPTERPIYGQQFDEYYENFFQLAFTEIRDAIEGYP